MDADYDSVWIVQGRRFLHFFWYKIIRRNAKEILDKNYEVGVYEETYKKKLTYT